MNGADGKPIKIPCACPPDRQTFVQVSLHSYPLPFDSHHILRQELNKNVAAGHVINNPSVGISFPEDNSKGSQLARINAASVTLQNLNGPGKGCPVVSTTFQAQAAAINAGAPPPPPAKRSPSPSPASSPLSARAPPASSPGAPSAAQIEAVAPPLGFTAGKNPTGELISLDLPQ